MRSVPNNPTDLLACHLAGNNQNLLYLLKQNPPRIDCRAGLLEFQCSSQECAHTLSGHVPGMLERLQILVQEVRLTFPPTRYHTTGRISFDPAAIARFQGLEQV